MEEEETGRRGHTHTLCKATHHRNRMYTVQEHRLLQKKSNNNIPKSMHSTRVCLTKTLCHLSYFETIVGSNLCQRKTFTNHWRLKTNLLNSWWSYPSTDDQVNRKYTMSKYWSHHSWNWSGLSRSIHYTDILLLSSSLQHVKQRKWVKRNGFNFIQLQSIIS